MIEQIIAYEQLQGAGSQFYFFRTYAGAEIDLIVDRGYERAGYEFKCSLSANRKDWANLKKGMEDGVIHKGYVVYLGERSYPVADKINVVGAESFLKIKT
jgi:predicted AAA+ superfamily ATPase